MSRILNVYLCGNKIGILREDFLSQITFQYDSNTVAPLSVRLPVREEEYLHPQAFPFFENLVPEGESFEILTNDHISGNKIFSFLDKFGGDCAGAVSFYKTIILDNKYEKLYEISSDKFIEIIDKLPQDPLLSGLKNPPRLSLAGAQAKFAIYKSNSKYYRSNDKYPTTHIIKITNKRFPHLLSNEFFCMQLAKKLQLGVPETTLKEISGVLYLEIERYDRKIEEGAVFKIHQEDFCQALGFISDKKYQSNGGVSLRACFDVIEKFSKNKLIDTKRFVEWIVFNYLIGNTDAHAKNISLIYEEKGIRLAPFYDLLSTEIYTKKIVDHSMAMLINGKGKYDSLTSKDFIALFKQLGLNSSNMMKSLKDKFENIISIAKGMRDKLIDNKSSQKRSIGYAISNDNIIETEIYDKIIAIIKKRSLTLFKTN